MRRVRVLRLRISVPEEAFSSDRKWEAEEWESLALHLVLQWASTVDISHYAWDGESFDTP